MIGLISLGGGLAIGLVARITKERRPHLFIWVALLVIFGAVDASGLIHGAVPVLLVRAVLGGLWLMIANSVPAGTTQLMFYMGACVIWIKSVLAYLGK